MLRSGSFDFDKVMKSNDFNTISNEKLVSCISKVNRNQTKESSIFQAIVAWTSHDVEFRKFDFPGLFKMLHLHKVPMEYLKEVILEEPLVASFADCNKMALRMFRKLVEEQQSKLRESKVLRLGGMYDATKVTVVFDVENESSLKYSF